MVYMYLEIHESLRGIFLGGEDSLRVSIEATSLQFLLNGEDRYLMILREVKHEVVDDPTTQVILSVLGIHNEALKRGSCLSWKRHKSLVVYKKNKESYYSQER